MSDPSDTTKPEGYDPRTVEERWYPFWEKHGVFAANEAATDARPVYVIPMPPPNVTGSLHMGHALQDTLQDILIRWERMRGKNALWQPGIDHAGIATQTVVERELKREGKTRHDLGREAFEKRVWQWKAERGDMISRQKRFLGDSADWKRSKFTMDPDMSHAVREAFVRLHEEGLMYRATRLINWCPECRTALSDLEVENEENPNGELFQFAYQVEGSHDELIVATTRPETMLGDTAVAVHPADPRYTHLHGKRLVHPFLPRTVPVITDEILVDMKFGTGAVKVTPAHDFNDFATGKRHKLEEINIFNLDGTMNEHGGPFAGLDRKKARNAVKQALDEKGLARGTKQHAMVLPKCQRSGGVVEPMISTQWFLKMEGMAKAALEAVHSKKTVILPEEWEKTYDHFLENIQDWCVSRQLWWGHQIPAWHGPNGEIKVARERPAECTEEAGWTQDADVLDTWFSSALWPFATQGWPNDTAALKKFYPASDLVTGYDILFFWVARMMMFGLHFMKDVPFRRVLLTSIIVDENGDKMSKVKGNVIDPLDLIQGADFTEVVKKTLPGAPEAEAFAKFKRAYPSTAQMGKGFPAFGADALRFTLSTYPRSARRIALAPKRIEGYRFFANKMWNATRFALEHVKNVKPSEKRPSPKALHNQWILSRLGNAAQIANEGLASYRIDDASNELYRFFWYDLCDWFLELAKIDVATNGASEVEGGESVGSVDETREVLAYVLEAALRLIHPLMPFVTEDLWQRVPRPASRPVSVALAPYPKAEDGAKSAEVDKQMATLQAVISAARTIRSEHEVKPASPAPLSLRTDSAELRALLAAHTPKIQALVKSLGAPALEAPGAPRMAGTAFTEIVTELGNVQIHVGLKGLVSGSKERERIAREKKSLTKDIELLTKKLGTESFISRAPAEVVLESKTQLEQKKRALAGLDESLKLAEELGELEPKAEPSDGGEKKGT